MATMTSYGVQKALIGYYKTQPQILAFLVSGTQQIREGQFQGVDFIYPAIRVYVDAYPSINGCGPDRVMMYTEVFSEQKSSREAKLIASTISSLLHKSIITSQGLKFSMIRIVEEHAAIRSIYAWMAKIDIEALVNG